MSGSEDVDDRCRRALLAIAADVRDINHKLSFFLESSRYDFYQASRRAANGDDEG